MDAAVWVRGTYICMENLGILLRPGPGRRCLVMLGVTLHTIPDLPRKDRRLFAQVDTISFAN